MASEKQILANRANAKRSTGPRTAYGRARTSRNAFKHGLTARTVIDVLEDDQEFRAFAKGIADQYRPDTPLRRELVDRLIAMLWRLRRAHGVETGLLSIQGKLQRDIHVAEPQPDMLRLFGLESAPQPSDPAIQNERLHVEARARAFLRMMNFNTRALDQLNRYEVALWRQAIQVMVMLDRPLRPANYQTKPIRRLA